MLKLLPSRGLRIEAGEKRAREQKTKCDWPERGVAFRRSRTKHERETIRIPALQALGDPQIAIAITIEKTVGGFGGTDAAPIAKAVMESLLR